MMIIIAIDIILRAEEGEGDIYLSMLVILDVEIPTMEDVFAKHIERRARGQVILVYVARR